MSKEYEQATMFEEDFIIRTSGSVTQKPDNALTELIANSWDAGAQNVNIVIPEMLGKELSVEDDGTGMTEEEFNRRWLTLNYNRLIKQGREVEFPEEVKGVQRKAYGRNGIGRHGMFCFSNSYHIDTWKNGTLFSCDIKIAKGEKPFEVYNVKRLKKDGHGTKLLAKVEKNLPPVKAISEILSARYLYDPMFLLSINGELVDLNNHSGLRISEEIEIENIKLKIFIIESNKTALKSVYHGIAFWVGKRLVGEPSWELGKEMVRDGRTQFAKRYTVIVTSDDLYDDVLPDWTGFKNNERVQKVYDKVKEYVESFIREISKDKREETKLEIAREHIDSIKELSKTSQDEISEFIDGLIENKPDINEDVANIAVEAMVNIQKARTGRDLLKKLSEMSEDDIDSLNKILESWTVKDIQTTLDTIDKRLLVIEAIERLCANQHTDELHTLHPLVAQAKWLFGPEFDSDMYAFNKRLNTIIKDIIKSDRYTELAEPNRRPDLVVFEESSFSLYPFEDWNETRNLYECKKILIIELKKGGFEITRKEMNQASDYVDAIANSTNFGSKIAITAYVVGDKISNNISKDGAAGGNRIFACTYMELASTAKARLFRLKDVLNERYEQMSTESIVEKVLKEPKQMEITMKNLNK